jgi:hypothetical protein
MNRHTRTAVAIQALLGVSLAFATLTTERLVAQSDPMRELYENKEEFDKLSGAAQTLLELIYGKRSAASMAPTLFAGPSAAVVSGPSIANAVSDQPDQLTENVLVNDPLLDTVRDTQSDTTLVVGPHQTIVAGFNDSGSFGPPTNNKFTGYSRSTDYGNSFTDLGTLPNSTNGDAGDPVLAHHEATGAIYFSTLQFSGSGMQVFKSIDNGLSFGTPVNGAPGTTGMQDKEWITVDNFPGAGNGNVYLAWRDFGPGNGIKFSRSTDAGATFGPTGGVLIAAAGAFNVQGAFVMVGPDHAVYVFWLDQSAGSGTPNIIRVRKSTDQGVSFGAAINVVTLNTNGVNGSLALAGGFRSNTFPQAAANPVNGDLYVVYADCSSTPCTTAVDHGNVFFRRSTDGGASWSAAVKVNDDSGTQDQFMPVITVTPNGQQLFVGWYDRRLGPNTVIDRFGSIATINLAAGDTVSFLPNQRITTESFPVVIGQDPVVNPVYMGDYDQAVSDFHSFHMTWGDNRRHNPNVPTHLHQPDVRYFRITMVPVAVRPASCGNTFNVNERGIVPVAINGTPDLDVSQIDPASVRLEGVAPISWAFEDSSSAYFPLLGKSAARACTSAGPDAVEDLILQFDSGEVAAALPPAPDGTIVTLKLTGTLLPAYGGYPILGEDVVVVMHDK